MKGTGYLLQATLISLWWIGLLLNQQFFDAFQFPGIGVKAFNAFLLPDLVIIALLSVIRAYNKKTLLEYIILGGFGFATLYCINATLLTGGGFISTTIMILGFCFNLFLVNAANVFRKSTSNSLLVNLTKTIFQILCVWLITLFVFPILILDAFEHTSIASYNIRILAILLFVFFSIIGLWSAYVMVKNGNGTPLPIDQTQKLVTKGTYKYVRNPMAIAGIGQGVAVSIYCLSIHIFIYSMIGAILWQFVVRPIEEENMIKRFGSEYEAYRKSIKCWIPTFN